MLAHARTLGFGLCRVARCDAPPHAPSFAAWLDEGMAGEMTPWLERGKEKRANPQTVLPGARSMIVLALDYWQGASSRAAAGVCSGGQGRPLRLGR